MSKDITTLFRYLLPALRPHIFSILGSLSITGIVIGTDLLQPYCLKNLLDAATITFNYQQVLMMLFVLLILVGLRSAFSYWDGFVRTQLGEAISSRYRKQLFEHILHLPLGTLHEIENGVLEHRVMNDCGTIGRVYVATQFLPLIASIIQAIALMIFIILLSWQVGLASIVVFPLGWLITQRMTHRNHTQLIRLRTIVEHGHGLVQEIISCIREVRAVGNEAGEMRRWNSWLQDYGHIVCHSTAKRQFIRITLSRLIDWIGLCIVFGWGGLEILQNHMSIGTLFAMALYVQQLYSTFSAILGVRIETGETANALQSIHEILQLPREWPEKGIKDLGKVHGELVFENVCFSYTNHIQNLEEVSFKNAAGNILGIVGPSGSGKSTLIHLCMRFYAINRGRILLDGRDITEIAPHTLRQQIGVVSQDIQLWNATIRENLLYGVQEDLSWEYVLEICKQTQVHTFVEQLPEQYETIVGLRGVKLSGGEKQRIALTRILLRKPRILLLDEATSALDSLTEAVITNMLLKNCEQSTRILVAHRLSTVQGADQIIVMNKGKVVESGSPDLLYHQNGLYTELHRTQSIHTEEKRTFIDQTLL